MAASSSNPPPPPPSKRGREGDDDDEARKKARADAERAVKMAHDSIIADSRWAANILRDAFRRLLRVGKALGMKKVPDDPKVWDVKNCGFKILCLAEELEKLPILKDGDDGGDDDDDGGGGDDGWDGPDDDDDDDNGGSTGGSEGLPVAAMA